MAKDKKDKGNGAAQVERTDVEQQPANDGAGDMPPTAQPGEQEPTAETTATEAPQDEPGPEDFGRHSSARLVDEHARDLALLDDVSRRIRNRGPEIAQRALRSGTRNPIVKIGGRVFTPRKRPEKAGGGVGLAEVGERSEASLD